jgi:hypothetical protein
MNKEEIQIWIAAYSAAFVIQFKADVEYYKNLPYQNKNDFDRTARNIDAEEAFTIADLAVQSFRVLKESEKKTWPNHELYSEEK